MSNKTKAKRNIAIVLMVVLVVLFFGIEYIVRGCAAMQKVALPKLKSEEFIAYKKYFDNYAQTPPEYITDQFLTKGRDILFIGDTYSFQQNLNLIKELIPALHDSGIINLGVDFVLYTDQPQIDKLLTAPVYDESAVYRLLFNRFVLWGYQEYADLFKAVWTINRNMANGDRPFRIVGLALKENWQYIRSKKDQENADIIKKVYADGLPDDYIYHVIQEKFIVKNEKALIYCNVQHALLHYINKQFDEGYKKLGFEYKGSVARQVYEQIGERCGSVLLNNPWPGRNNPAQPVFPAEGYMAFLINTLPPEKQKAGFDVTDSPFGQIQLKNCFFAGGKDTVLLKDLCSGYLINGPINQYVPATVIPGFINAENLADAKQYFPGPKDDSLTIDRLNNEVENNARKLSDMLKLFE